jgi:FkbM family methyltransferase
MATPLSPEYLKKRAKNLLRPLIPAHRRFIRSGEHFRLGGEREVHELPSLVTAGSVAVDVGAHIGDYTYSLCKAVAPGGQVIAVEPLPDLARFLIRATKKLGLPVTVLNCALSAQPGHAELSVPLNDGLEDLGFATLVPRVSGGKTVRVEVRRLDDVCSDVAGKISFVKIDVEGHELDVLRGSEAMIKLHRPNLLIEIEQRHSLVPISETFAYVLSLGYRGEFIEEDKTRHPLDEFQTQTHQTSRLGQKSYISNFIFRPI